MTALFEKSVYKRDHGLQLLGILKFCAHFDCQNYVANCALSNFEELWLLLCTAVTIHCRVLFLCTSVFGRCFDRGEH